MRRKRVTDPNRPNWRARMLAVPVTVLLAAGAVAGCGAGDAPGGPGGPASEGGSTVSPTIDPSPTDPGPVDPGQPGNPPASSGRPPVKGGPGGPSGGSVATTLTGTVSAGVEANCLLLDGYLLIGGDRNVIRAGARISVTGRPEPGLMTTCQQGTPFQVESARAA